MVLFCVFLNPACAQGVPCRDEEMRETLVSAKRAFLGALFRKPNGAIRRASRRLFFDRQREKSIVGFSRLLVGLFIVRQVDKSNEASSNPAGCDSELEKPIASAR